MTTDKRGVSALLMQRQLGLSRYETSWMMLHKLRRAMVNATREPLRGEVEVDDTWVGGEQAGLRGSRQLKNRRAALVLVAVEKRGKGSGRARMRVIPDFKAATIIPFLTQNVAPGSTIYTDGLKSFVGLSEAGFKHVARNQPLRSELRKGAKSAVPLADRAIGNLQQWLIGTYHGVSKAQLQVYLDEFIFRHNRRKTPAAAFQTLLGFGTGRKSTEYEKIRGARDLNPNLLGPAEATGLSEAVYSEQDLNKRDKFWKRTTLHRWRESGVTPVRHDRDRVHQVPAPKPLWVALDHFDRVALNRDFSRCADLASRRNEVKPRAPIHGVCNSHHSPVSLCGLAPWPETGAKSQRTTLVGLRSQTSLDSPLTATAPGWEIPC